MRRLSSPRSRTTQGPCPLTLLPPRRIGTGRPLLGPHTPMLLHTSSSFPAGQRTALQPLHPRVTLRRTIRTRPALSMVTPVKLHCLPFITAASRSGGARASRCVANPSESTSMSRLSTSRTQAIILRRPIRVGWTSSIVGAAAVGEVPSHRALGRRCRGRAPRLCSCRPGRPLVRGRLSSPPQQGRGALRQ